ncbi:U3 small nucleolar RNA-associated protein 23 [Entomortierella parvispora]|uniref:U three protein 23 n=1 Tax=Entomortierella parvispora TaxID=205924 RepID=A0A9P3M1P0_9FUNG|nr:U3 small nucleolar RNA-associated protein 23 [Entomortierella parvispora]
MRLKRSKDYKRYMNMYCQTFHFRKPFQVLVDADFIQAALDQRIDLRTQIPKVLCDASKQMVSPCTMALLKSRGEDASGAFLASKRFEKRRCKHQTAVDEAICLGQIIGNSNPHNYVVASQSKKLRSQFGQIPGVPLLYINRSNLILEPPSDASMNKSKSIETAKTHASTRELQTLKAVKVTGAGKVSVDTGLVKKLEKKQESKKEKRELLKAKILKKRMGPKEPNPLSVKKKKVVATPKPAPKATPAPSSTEGDESTEKKKTRRSKKSKAGKASTEAGNESSS